MAETDQERADAIEIIRDALDTICDTADGLDAWQHHYLLRAFEHLYRGLYGEAITYTEDALTPPEERNGASVPDISRRRSLADMRRDLKAFDERGRP